MKLRRSAHEGGACIEQTFRKMKRFKRLVLRCERPPAITCEFRRKPAGDTDLKPARFRFEAGHHSEMKPAT